MRENDRQTDRNPRSRTRPKNLRRLRHIHIIQSSAAQYEPITPVVNRRRRAGRRLTDNVRIVTGLHDDSELVITSCESSASPRPNIPPSLPARPSSMCLEGKRTNTTRNAAFGRARSCTLIQQGVPGVFNFPPPCVRYRIGRYEEELKAAFSISCGNLE